MLNYVKMAEKIDTYYYNVYFCKTNRSLNVCLKTNSRYLR